MFVVYVQSRPPIRRQGQTLTYTGDFIAVNQKSIKNGLQAPE